MDIYKNSKDIIFTTPLPNPELLSKIPRDSKILEIGSGYGRVLKYLHQIGFTNLTGVECSESLIIRAKSEFPQATYLLSDAVNISSQEKYDLILMCGTMEYFIGEKRDRLYKVIDRHLTNDGLLYLELFTYDLSCWNQYIRGLLNTKSFGAIQLSNGIILQHTSINKMIRDFKNVGKGIYQPVYSKRMKFKTWSGTEANGGILILRKRRK